MKISILSILLICIISVSFVHCYNDDEELMALRLPKWSAKTLKWFGIDPNAKLPVEPERVSKLSKEQFDRKYAAKGIPFIVTDMTKDWGASKWTCNSLAERFPKQEVTAWTDEVYGEGELKKRTKFKLEDPFLKSIMTIDSYQNITEEEQEERDLTKDMPSIVSWLWFPIERSPGSPISEVQQELIDDIGIPYFAQDNELNKDTMYGRLEIFFGLPGSGVNPHSDEICKWILSSQTSGKKGWLLTLLPDAKKIEKLNPGYKYNPDDSNLLISRLAKEQPIWRTELQAGETLVFPPGVVHRTLVPEDGGCSLSFSSQISYPAPTKYIRQFEGNLIDHDHGPRICFIDLWNKGLYGVSFPDSDGTRKGNDAFARAFFNEVDTNGDGKLQNDEVSEFFAQTEYEKHLPIKVAQFFRFNDANRDGIVSKKEYRKCLKSWTPRVRRNCKITGGGSAESLIDIFVEPDVHDEL